MDLFILLLALPMALGIYLLAVPRNDSRWRVALTVVGTSLVALPLGGLAYFFCGIWIARARGVGHFFSVPFGGYAVSDSAVLSSLACWVGIIFALVTMAFRRRLKRLP